MPASTFITLCARACRALRVDAGLRALLPALLILPFACAAAVAQERPLPRALPACAVEKPQAGYEEPCKQALSPADTAQALAKLKDKNFAYAIEGDSLLVALRAAPSELIYPEGPYLCCDLKGHLDKVADDVYVARFRSNRMAESLLDMVLMGVKHRRDAAIRHNGSPVFALASRDDPAALEAAGFELTGLSLPAGAMLGERTVSIVKGVHCRASLAACSVIYMPDGESSIQFAANALANGVDMRRFVIVGVFNAKVDANRARMNELLPGHDDARYAAFMGFVTGELMRRVERGEVPLRRFAAGYSNGGVWAYDALLANPALFAGAIVMSPGLRTLRPDARLDRHRVFIGAGYMEPPFRASTLFVAQALRERGAQVEETYVPSGHGMDTWVNLWNAAIQSLNAAPQ